MTFRELDEEGKGSDLWDLDRDEWRVKWDLKNPGASPVTNPSPSPVTNPPCHSLDGSGVVV